MTENTQSNQLVMKTYIFDVAFSVQSTAETWEAVPHHELVAALRRRLEELESDKSADTEAFGLVDEYE